MKTQKSRIVKTLVVIATVLLFCSFRSSAPPCPFFVKNHLICPIEIVVKFYGNYTSPCSQCPGAAGTQTFNLMPGQQLALPCAVCGNLCDYAVTVTKVAGGATTNSPAGGSHSDAAFGPASSNWNNGSPCGITQGTNIYDPITQTFDIK